jgi:hypothetical protein
MTMVRILKSEQFDPDQRYIEATGLSTDTKPSGEIITGSKFNEVNTGKKYRFDEVSGEWYVQPGGQV